MFKKLMLLTAATAVIAAAAVSAAPADAARGGPKNPAPNAQLTVSPNPAAAWGAQFTLHGSGFAPNSSIQLGQSIAGGCCRVSVLTVDGNGEFTINGYTQQPGAYIFTAYVSARKSSWQAVASVTLNVVE